MSNNKILIDASHPEETRVVVLRGNRIEEFDFEAADKKPLRGNIYLAKVTRVEPSLQAAFVEYGGNRHGFLAFSEIHPDYYQIPVADRQALLEDEAREQREEADEEERRSNRRNTGRRRRGGRQARRSANRDETVSTDVPAEEGETADFEQDANPSNDANSAGPGLAGENGEQDTSAQSEPVSASHEDQNAETPNDVGSATETIDPNAAGEPVSADAPAGDVASASTPDGVPQPDGDETQTSVQDAAEGSRDARENAVAGADDREDAAAQGSVASTGSELSAADSESASPGDERTGDFDPPEADDAPAFAGELHDDSGESDGENDDDEDGGEDSEDDEEVEQVGGDSEEDIQPAPRRARRQYKIQEVIKRRQIMLIQVVKEERGNKGAALTTYLSLAGRYSVLMPNTARGGGISRKITDGEDRRRMKEIAQDLDVPGGMGVILRTAGASRTNQEIRRDFEYLLRLWESVREMTLHSSAPTLVYEEGSLVKRSIRDLYGKDVDEVIVAGEAGHREAKDFMRMLMPSHARHVKLWREQQPIFARSGVEPQLDSLFSPNVTLKSGGYIVINQTEALVAIDVNSGRSTREHNIEDTALRTNLEAADEIARQLRLRDLAGLIVVDFIDMDEHRNNRAVERRMKDALKSDRARIQVGRISHFGLLEMSRQRMRTGVLEGSSIVCPHCQGSGHVRSTASIALHVLRLIEEALLRNNNFNLFVKTRAEVALYILNQKRATLTELEQRFGVALSIDADDGLTGTTYHAIECGEPATAPVASENPALQFSSPADEEDAPAGENQADAEEAAGGDEERPARSRGRRGQRNRGRRRNSDPADDPANEEAADNGSTETASEAAGEENPDGDNQKRRRRRRRRVRGERDPSGISAEAPQPSDDGLAYIAETNGQPDSAAAESAEFGSTDIGASPESDAAGVSASDDTNGADDSIAHSDRTARRARVGRGGFRQRRRGQNAANEDGAGDEAASDETASEMNASGEDAAASLPAPGENSTSATGNGNQDGGVSAPATASEAAPGSWVKSPDAGAGPEGAEPETYPFASPSQDIDVVSETPVESNDALHAATAKQDEVAETTAHAHEAHAHEDGPGAGNGADTEPASQAGEDESDKPSPRREIEALPEAPAPAVKRTGWWRR